MRTRRNISKMRRRTSNPERPTEQIERIERVERVERVERQKAKRSDKRSLDLFRQRDRLMAEAKLEDAVKAISTQSGLLLSGRCATSSSTASSLKRHRTWSAGDGHSAEQAKSTGGRYDQQYAQLTGSIWLGHLASLDRLLSSCVGGQAVARDVRHRSARSKCSTCLVRAPIFGGHEPSAGHVTLSHDVCETFTIPFE